MFSLIPKNQIIKNINNIVCKECVYFKKSSKILLSKCMKYGEKNLITGRITYNTANSCRKDENKCGMYGYKFELMNGRNHIVAYNINSHNNIHKNNTFDNPGC